MTIGRDPDWVPGEADLAAIAEVNQRNVDAAPDDAELAYRVAGPVFLLGEGHAREHATYVRFQSDSASGTATVHQGGALDQGSLEVTDVPYDMHDTVEESVERFSGCKVVFI